jgi:hypothetical protein
VYILYPPLVRPLTHTHTAPKGAYAPPKQLPTLPNLNPPKPTHHLELPEPTQTPLIRSWFSRLPRQRRTPREPPAQQAKAAAEGAELRFESARSIPLYHPHPATQAKQSKAKQRKGKSTYEEASPNRPVRDAIHQSPGGRDGLPAKEAGGSAVFYQRC